MPIRFLKSIIAAGCFAAAFAAHADEGYPAQINIGIQKGDGLVALRASGKLEQAFASHHVKVSWHEFVYGAPLVEAINAGDVDVGTVGSTPPIMAQAGAAPSVVYVAYAPRLVKSYAIVVPKDSPVKDLRDLKGRKIAFAKGSQGHLFVLKAMQDAHMDPNAAQFTYLSYGDARSAFERGFIDAWAVPDPRYADTELTTGARTILTIGDLSVPQYGFYIATRDFAQKYPAALRLLFDRCVEHFAGLRIERRQAGHVKRVAVAGHHGGRCFPAFEPGRQRFDTNDFSSHLMLLQCTKDKRG